LSKQELKQLLLHLIELLEERKERTSRTITFKEQELSKDIESKIYELADFIVRHRKELGF